MRPPLDWSLHNLVAHPLSEVLHLAGVALESAGAELRRLSERVHDETVPTDAPDDSTGKDPTNA